MDQWDARTPAIQTHHASPIDQINASNSEQNQSMINIFEPIKTIKRVNA